MRMRPPAAFLERRAKQGSRGIDAVANFVVFEKGLKQVQIEFERRLG